MGSIIFVNFLDYDIILINFERHVSGQTLYISVRRTLYRILSRETIHLDLDRDDYFIGGGGEEGERGKKTNKGGRERKKGEKEATNENYRFYVTEPFLPRTKMIVRNILPVLLHKSSCTKKG